MELTPVQPAVSLKDALLAPPCTVHYRPVFWEPVAGTGERVVALMAIEPHDSSHEAVAAATYVVLSPERLRAMLGRQRGTASQEILQQAADFMTQRQQAGLPVEELQAPFQGMSLGTEGIARGYCVEQTLDAAVRVRSGFGSAEAMLEESVETDDAPARHGYRTKAFLARVANRVKRDAPERTDRFNVTFKADGLPELTVDYAWRNWLVQVTSLPATKRQEANVHNEALSRLYEIDTIRRHFARDGNTLRPVLMINEDVLTGNPDNEARDIALGMRERLSLLARADALEIRPERNADAAAEWLQTLA